VGSCVSQRAIAACILHIRYARNKSAGHWTLVLVITAIESNLATKKCIADALFLRVSYVSCKNQSIFGENMNVSLVSCFFDSRCNAVKTSRSIVAVALLQ